MKPVITATLKQERRTDEICRQALRKLNESRGGQNMSKKDFARSLGINESTWYRWNCASLEGVPFDVVLNALQKAGVKFEITFG